MPSQPRTRFAIVTTYMLTAFAVIVQLSCAVAWLLYGQNAPLWFHLGVPALMLPAVVWLIHTGFNTRLVLFPYSTLGWLAYTPKLPQGSRSVGCVVRFPGLITHGKLSVDAHGCTIKLEMIGTFRVTWHKGGTIEWVGARDARVLPSRDCPLKYGMDISVYFWEDMLNVRC